MAAGWEEGRNGELLIFRFLPPPERETRSRIELVERY